MWKKLLEVIRLCCTPYSIFSPIPFFAVIVFLIASEIGTTPAFDIRLLLIGLTASVLSSFASNIWNHANDLRDDIAQGRNNALTQKIISQKSAIIISFVLYIFSITIMVAVSVNVGRPAYIFFLIWAFITWWYSDNIFLRKLIGFRLKSHYVGEFITYAVAYPMYTLSIWFIYSNFNTASILFSIAFLFFGISVVLLKDLKDISGDRSAKLKTFGVVFKSSRLFQWSCVFLFLYYLVILSSITFNIFHGSILLIIIPFIFFVSSSFLHFNKKNWNIGYEDGRQIRTIVLTTYASIILLGAGTLI